uniref:Reverse transcriptase zinc-binding domain-containing protein n=1 Tax=Aegilops tauschii subsp. strangulata TaxID=200361 RepID=A0A453DFT9_AEGTS
PDLPTLPHSMAPPFATHGNSPGSAGRRRTLEFFHWLTHQVRCWIADRLARRSLQHPAHCPLCDQAPETM